MQEIQYPLGSVVLLGSVRQPLSALTQPEGGQNRQEVSSDQQLHQEAEKKAARVREHSSVGCSLLSDMFTAP